jgi:hypothetical protein
MGPDEVELAERRAVERFRGDDYPDWKAKIDRTTGFEVPVDVAWDELAVAEYSSSYATFFPKVYFQPLVDALSAITIDEIGRSAVRDGLRKIVVRNTDQYSSTSGFAFQDGVLTIDHKPHTNVDDGEERAKGLQRMLESGL